MFMVPVLGFLDICFSTFIVLMFVDAFCGKNIIYLAHNNRFFIGSTRYRILVRP